MNIQLCAVDQYVSIDALKLHPNNPRTISKEKLALLKQSIIDKGFYQPILVWSEGNIILAGNHRYLAVQELLREGYTFKQKPKGKDVLPVVMEEVSAEVAEAILYETNNSYAEWVEERLALALREAKEAGRQIESFGFDTEWVDVLLKTTLSDVHEAVPPSKPGEYDPDKIQGVLGEADEFESLILPKPVYDQACELLAQIAKGINKEWSGGDSYALAMQTLCQYAREKGIEELWLKPKPSPAKSTRSRLSLIEK